MEARAPPRPGCWLPSYHGTKLSCDLANITPLSGARTAAAEVSVALNAVHFVSAVPPPDVPPSKRPSTYLYYKQAVDGVGPTGGPVAGGTVVTVSGLGFDALGDGGASARCKFGARAVPVLTAGSALDDDSVRCVAPPREAGGGGAVGFSLALNSVHFVSGKSELGLSTTKPYSTHPTTQLVLCFARLARTCQICATHPTHPTRRRVRPRLSVL